MKKYSTIIAILSISALFITSCNKKGNTNSSSKESPFETDVTVEMDAGLNANKKSYSLSFKYSDEYFLRNAKTYDKELSKLSFANSLVSKSVETGNAFYQKIEFKDFSANQYDITPTENSCAYMFAHKMIDDCEVVSISFRGFNYQKEWANNFQIGKTGNHNGFEECATAAYTKLQTYISTYCEGKPLKLWINGYSRGGALANVLSSIILSDSKIDIKQENMFTYTFEAPRGLCETKAVPYQNVHNIVNSGDFITHVAPEEYYLYRCGVDYEIYDADIATIIKSIDIGIDIPAFETFSGYKNDIDVINYVLGGFVRNQYAGLDATANDREHFVDNYGSGVSYFFGLLFSFSDSTLSLLKNEIMNMKSHDSAGLLAMLNDDTGVKLSNFLKTYLSLDLIPYDAEELTSNCAVIAKGFKNLGDALLMVLTSHGNDMTRILDMHYPEATYALLLNKDK